MTWPRAESGYYVYPVSLVDEVFRKNGMVNAGEMHSAAPAKLRAIFGADAALYFDIENYGAS